MRRVLRTSILATAAVAAVVAIYIALTLPRPSVALVGAPSSNRIIGAYHIHTDRSDGSGSVEDVARAARRAGIAFVVLTDHGDGTRPPDPPAYRDGVLCIDAAEINSIDGHIVALGLAGPAPYPLAGPARDVIEDIHRLGGWAVIAHPESPRADLRFRAQNVPFDGIEWLNVDSEWRDETEGLMAAAVRGLLRPAETMATFFARPVRTLQRWDAAARTRPVFGLAALDAHARIGWKEDEEPRQRTAFARPTYEAMFRTLVQSVELEAPLSGHAVDDARRVLSALVAGRSFSIVRALAFPATLDFSVKTDGGAAIPSGGRMDVGQAPATLHVEVPEAPGARIVVLQNGREIAAARGPVNRVVSEPGVYRAEVFFPGGSAPWLMSNPIVIDGGRSGVPFEGRGRADGPGPGGRGRGGVSANSDTPLEPLSPIAWRIEHDPSSSGTVAGAAAQPEFTFVLGSAVSHGQYAALVAPLQMERGANRIAFVGRASRPVRISIQVRLPGGRDGERWRRSVYLDQSPRSVELRLEDFEPADAPTSRRPVAVPLQSLLFVVDTVNAAPGSRGIIWLSEIAVGLDGSLPGSSLGR